MTDPTNSPEALGSRYLLDAPIGAGAMGQVWRGRTHEGESLAIKVLRPELSSDPAVVTRFVQEAQILTRLDDTHLVRVRDLVAEGSRLAIVMDLVEGPDLRTELARRGTYRPIDALAVVDGVLAGLTAVHAGGVVHRDVKPENVLLAGGRPDEARLTDFGVARIAEESQKARRTTVIGTPEYLAPEVADGATPTPASDLYAVGVMLYELVAGVTPFSGGSPLAVLRRHAEQQPTRPEGMPDAVWAAVTALLAKDPAQRPPSAEAFRAWLASAAPSVADAPQLRPLEAPPAPPVVSQPTVTGLRSETQPVPATEPAGTRSPEPRRRRRWPVALAAVLTFVVVLGVLTVVLLKPSRGNGAAEAATPSSSSSASSSERETSAGRSSTAARSTTSAPSGGVAPSVTGLTLASAQTAITNAGLRVVVTEVLDETVADNTVMAQDPIEGTRLERGDTVTLTVARRPVGTFLTSLDAVETSGYSMSAGSTVTMNGVTYIHPVSSSTSCGDTVSIQYDLGRSYREFEATVGLSDGSQSAGLIQFDVFVDGRSVFTQTATLGAPVPVAVDVTGGLRLNVSATRIEPNCRDGWDDADVYAVWGDPTLYGVPSEVPSPVTTTGAALPTN
ncbi:protein kinase [Geodermatophilus sp. SYSU D01180]